LPGLTLTRFETDTAVTSAGAGRYEARIDPAWWVYRGPHGGYVGAIVMRAMVEAVGDGERVPRSFTIHYVRPPEAGPVEIVTTVEREGRSMTSMSARLLQQGETFAIALGAFSRSRPSIDYAELTMPDVPPADQAKPLAVDGAPPHIGYFSLRPVLGPPPFSGGDRALTGGWMRLAEAQVADAPAVVAYSDAWMPAIFSRIRDRVGVPTVDLTVHFRAPVPVADVSPDDHYLVVFRTPVANDGFLVEDGEIWSPSGVLLAQSRQLAATLPLR